MYAVQSFFHFALMLAVMYVWSFHNRTELITNFSCFRTFQAAYIITIIAGLGVGELFFGRLSSGDVTIHKH